MLQLVQLHSNNQLAEPWVLKTNYLCYVNKAIQSGPYGEILLKPIVICTLLEKAGYFSLMYVL